ncbi:MAG: hypothetical protein WA987_03895 [Cellvibrio sp.]
MDKHGNVGEYACGDEDAPEPEGDGMIKGNSLRIHIAGPVANYRYLVQRNFYRDGRNVSNKKIINFDYCGEIGRQKKTTTPVEAGVVAKKLPWLTWVTLMKKTGGRSGKARLYQCGLTRLDTFWLTTADQSLLIKQHPC